MTLEQLRIFVAVAYVENFTRAAERLGISQSAVSAAVATLESRYKILLFDRSHRNVELTEGGEIDFGIIEPEPGDHTLMVETVVSDTHAPRSSPLGRSAPSVKDLVIDCV